jgi:NADH dehydrogenase
MWIGIHIYFLIGFANRLLVMLQWSISFWTKRRGVRIFPLDREPRAPVTQRTPTSCDSGGEESSEGRMRAS